VTYIKIILVVIIVKQIQAPNNVAKRIKIMLHVIHAKLIQEVKNAVIKIHYSQLVTHVM
jgi:hypothetical protein